MFCHNRQTLAWRLNILAIPNNPLIFFKGIDIGTERYYPVGVESLLNTLLFKSRFRHMREAEVDTVVWHNINMLIYIKYFMSLSMDSLQQDSRYTLFLWYH